MHPHTHRETGPITIHCAEALLARSGNIKKHRTVMW